MDPFLLAGVGVLGAYLLSSKRANAPAGSAAPGGPAKTVIPSGMNDSAKKSIAKDVPYERFGDVLVRGANDGSQMPAGWKECFLDVGAKIPLSAITQKDVNLAASLLGGDLDRYGEAYTPRSLAILKAQGQIAAGKAVTDIFASLLSFIPVYGALVKTALSYASNDMQKGIDSLSQKMKSGQGIHVVIDLPNASDATKMILGNPTLDMIYLGINGNAYGNTSAGITTSGQRQGMLKEYLGGARDADIYEPDTTIPHCRLFTETRSGYVLPWLSLDLGASAMAPAYLGDWQSQFNTPDEGGFDPKERISTITWEEAVYRRAMCFRVFDMMVSQFWPAVQGGKLAALGSPSDEYTSYAGFFPYVGERYSFHSPLYGDLYESVFPPFPGEDTNIVTADGVKLDFHGRPIDPGFRLHEISIAQGGALVAALNVANAPGISQGQPLENFSTPGTPTVDAPPPSHLQLTQTQLTGEVATLAPSVLVSQPPAMVASVAPTVSNPPPTTAPSTSTPSLSGSVGSVRASYFSRYG